MKFEVTQKHIDAGTPGAGKYCDGEGCVLALAICDALKKRHKPRKQIDVGAFKIITINGKRYYHTRATEAVVSLFDSGQRQLIKPGVYEVTPAPAV